MDDRARYSWLLDFYGPLLTGRRRDALKLFLNEDVSLAEIARLLGITRQGAFDCVKAAEEQLKNLEGRLGLVGRHTYMLDGIEKAQSALKRGETGEALAVLSEIITKEGDGDGV